MAFIDLLPVADYRNEGWSITGASSLWAALNNDNNGIYISTPASKGGATVSFPIDVAGIPEGAVITSVTVYLRCQKTSGNPSITVNVSSSDDTSKFTSRTIYPTSTINEFKIATYAVDALGFNWDKFRLNKILCRVFSLAGILGAIRCFKFFCRVDYKVRPTVTIQKPSGTVNTPSPDIAWTYSQIHGDRILKTEYKIFTSQQQQQPNFNPDLTPPVFAETVLGDKSSTVLPTSLNNDNYWIYLRVWSVFLCKSKWASRSFTVTGPSPGVPGDDDALLAQGGIGTASVIPDSFLSAAAIMMRDSSNLLSVQQADFETAVDGTEYTATNCTLTRNTGIAFNGRSSLQLTATSAATISAQSTKIEVAPSTPMTVRAQVRANSTGRTVNVSIRFYDEDYTLLSGDTITGSDTDSSATWKEITATGTSPAAAAFADVRVQFVSAANTEIHYVDRVGLMYGTNTTWSHGGHTSRNLMSSHLATAEAPVAGAWTAGNTATLVERVTATGTGSHGSHMFRMKYLGVTPTLAHRGTGSFFTSPTSGVNYTLNKHASTAEGDLMLAFVTANVHTTITPPAGWEVVNTASTPNGTLDTALFILKRTAGPSEPSSWTDGVIGTAATRRTAVVVSYSGAAHADEQFLQENVRTDGSGNLTHTTATVSNTDPAAWRVSAFAIRDNASGGSMTANLQPPAQDPVISFVGKATPWGTSSSTTSFSVNRPAGTANGHLLIASVAARGAISTVTLSGWTLVRKTTQGGSDGTTLAIFKRQAGASEPSSWSGTLSSSGRPVVTQAVAYAGAAPVNEQFVNENSTTISSGSTINTATVNNNDSRSWRACVFAGSFSASSGAWTSSEIAERADNYSSYSTGLFSGSNGLSHAVYDSNGQVSTGNHQRSGTSSRSVSAAVSWIGIIKALPAPPTPPANETNRAYNTNGSANPWMTTAVFDSNGVAQSGSQSITGVFTPSSGTTIDTATSWIGIMKPAAPVVAGTVSARSNTFIDVSQVDPYVLSLAKNKMSMVAHFLGSTAGTSYLILDFYRGTEHLSTQVQQGEVFGSSKWIKSYATFDIPEGTTRILPTVYATDTAIDETVAFDRIMVAFGETSVWRNGTTRDEHPIWQLPEIQYSDNFGSGYGDWENLTGVSLNPPIFDTLSGQVTYLDHTVVPLANRRYRIRTITYGRKGDKFVSPWGTPTDEASFSARNWWLKDLQEPEDNMQLIVKADPTQVGTANTAVTFQPLGADYPVVLTEGYKADMFDLTLKVDRVQHAKLKALLKKGRTLLLQSDYDHTWWVRPVGDLQAETLVTGKRKTNPLRWVKVSFAEVAPPDF